MVDFYVELFRTHPNLFLAFPLVVLLVGGVLWGCSGRYLWGTSKHGSYWIPGVTLVVFGLISLAFCSSIAGIAESQPEVTFADPVQVCCQQSDVLETEDDEIKYINDAGKSLSSNNREKKNGSRS